MFESLKIDLHSHTTASDGSCTPSELVCRAVERNIGMLAITDHDSLDGISEARQTITEKKSPLKLIAGVEISSVWKGREIHIVGLNVDQDNKNLQKLLIAQQEKRLLRAQLIHERLDKCNILNVLEEAKTHSKGEAISRSHIARVLVDRGVVNSMQKAFKQYLGSSGRAYVAPQWISMDESINIIAEAKGCSVLAHPFRYNLSTSWVKRLISDFKLFGGKGIEVSQARQSHQELSMLVKLANEHQLLASQGSDFHHPNEYVELGGFALMPESVQPVWAEWL